MADPNDLNLNVSFHSATDDSEQIEMVLDDGTFKVPVLATILGGTFQLQPYVPKVDFDSTGVALNTSTWTEILNVTSTLGKLDFIAMVGTSSNYRVRLTVDGTEVLDISMADLNAIGLSNAINVSIWAETANKNFRYHPKAPVDFTDSLKIEAMAVTGTPTVTHLITYREQG